MKPLQLVGDEVEPAQPFAETEPLPRRLPPGRHGIPANLVVEHQRRRLLAAMAEAIAAHGYANVTTTHVSRRANVSTGTFYKHFGNLWDCVLAAYVAGSDVLCERIAAGCDAAASESARLEAGVEAALGFLAAQPAFGQLLCSQAPLEAPALSAARRLLVSRLATMLRASRGEEQEDAQRPSCLEERLIDGCLAVLGSRLARREATSLEELTPELVAILGRPRQLA